MLRITEEKQTEETLVLKLEGRLTGPWVELLRTQCAAHAAATSSLILELRELAFADAAGLNLLAQLQDQQVRLQNCAPFLLEQLKRITTAKPTR